MASTKGEEKNNNYISASSISYFTSELQQVDFTEEAIDVALRKLLAKVPLPKESQLIDQAMEDFAKRYHQCNPHLADSYEPIYAVAFSILLLHTDAHNKNVKRKMNKDTFIMRTKLIQGGETVYSEVLDIMYDNIVSTEFSYAQDQQDKSLSWFSKTSGQPNTTPMHYLYPKLEQLMPAINIFSYKPAPKSTMNITNIQQSIQQASYVLLAGVRSRQQQQQQQQTNGSETFLTRVCKAGIVERKYDLVHGGKRAPARGWRPFGMILSGSQIMYFGDLTSFQTWLASLQQLQQTGSNSLSESPSASTLPSIHNSLKARTPTTMSSFTTNNSDQALTSSSTSNLTIIPTTMTSLNTVNSSVTNNTFLPASSSANIICLRPMQIVSLSNAICVYDKSYRKYPHVFRLITGDGQQFLIRCSSADDMDDWIQKINYISAMKTTGVRLHPKITTNVGLGNYSNSHLYQHNLNSQQHLLGIHYYQHYQHHDGRVTQHWMKREHKAKAIIASLNGQLAEQQRQHAKIQQLRNQLMLLAPIQRTTKDRLLLFADSVGKRLLHDRMVLERLNCYREVIEWELFYYRKFNMKQEKLGDNSNNHRNCGGKTCSIPRKMSAPLPFYSGLFLGRQSATPVQQQQRQRQRQRQLQQEHATTDNLLQPPSLETTTTINNGSNNQSDETDSSGGDCVEYPDDHFLHRSSFLPGNNTAKNKQGDDLTTTSTNTKISKSNGDSKKLEITVTSIGNRRRSCPHFNIQPFTVFCSPDNDDGDQQQESAPLESGTACTNYHDGCHCQYQQQHHSIQNSGGGSLSTRQHQNQGNPFLATTWHSETDELQSLSSQPSNHNRQTHDGRIPDIKTDYNDNDNDYDVVDDDDIGFVVPANDDDTLVKTV